MPPASDERSAFDDAQTPPVRQWLNELEYWTSVARRPRVGKLVGAPGRLIASALLNGGARLTRRGIRRSTTTFWGDRMEVVLPERISTAIYRYRVHDPVVCELLLRHLKPGMVFFDVGAHFGYFSLLASRLVTDSGQVHSFEPMPATFETLEHNVRGHLNVIPVNCALHSTSGRLWMNDLGVEYSAYNSRFPPRLESQKVAREKAHSTEVTALTLDAYAARTGIAPDFVKIDAESSDFAVLEGMRATIQARHPLIITEVGDLDVPEAPRSASIVTLLKEAGYHAFRLRDHAVVELSEETRYEYDNLLFVPRSGQRTVPDLVRL